MEPRDIQSEAQQLRARFENGKINRAKFARIFKVPGGQSMVYQHINAMKPISMEAARAYMDGFKCKLYEISPYLAEEADRQAALSDSDKNQATEHKASERESEYRTNIVTLPKNNSSEVAEILQLIEAMSEKGHVMLLTHARNVVKEYPKVKANRAK